MSYFIKIGDLRPGHSMMFGYLFFLYSVARYLNGGVETILEIGVREGNSTNSFLYGLADKKRNGHLYSIDIKNYSKAGDEQLRHLWTFIQEDSQKVEWNRKIDILLIDGDHHYEGVKADYNKFEPFVRKGGIILMHDVLGLEEIRKVFEEEVKYPKIILPFSKAGMGMILK